MTVLLLTSFVIMVTLMILTWLIYLRTDRPDLVDASWAFGLAAIGIVFGIIGEGWIPRKLVIATMVSFWGLRLGFHLLRRILSHTEDGRYLEMRKEWKTNLPRRFFIFFQFQAILNVILSLPFAFAVSNTEPGFHILEFAGLGMFVLALFGESLADNQLRKFKADPANKGLVCQDGLWNYSRHPNYFFEWLIWIAFFVFALSSPMGWISIICPLLMLYFLFKVTGIPATEAQSIRSKGQAYVHYQKTTSAFFPWFKNPLELPS